MDDARLDLVESSTKLEVGEHKWLGAAHAPRIEFHHFQRRADVRREIDFIDYQQIGLGDAGPALARKLVASGDVDHVESQIGQLGTESGAEIVAATLDQHEIEIGKTAAQLVDRGEVHRRILADRRVRTAAGLDADDTLRRQGLVTGEKLRILFGVYVIGHRRERITRAQAA